jgi:hypothetical protein
MGREPQPPHRGAVQTFKLLVPTPGIRLTVT